MLALQFDPDFCNVASGWEKGVVEKNVQDSRRRIWLEAGTLRFGSFAELNPGCWPVARPCGRKCVIEYALQWWPRC